MKQKIVFAVLAAVIIVSCSRASTSGALENGFISVLLEGLIKGAADARAEERERAEREAAARAEAERRAEEKRRREEAWAKMERERKEREKKKRVTEFTAKELPEVIEVFAQIDAFTKLTEDLFRTVDKFGIRPAEDEDCAKAMKICGELEQGKKKLWESLEKAYLEVNRLSYLQENKTDAARKNEVLKTPRDIAGEITSRIAMAKEGK